MIYRNPEEVHITRDYVTCEKCHHVNVTNVKAQPKRKKRQRMVWVDTVTWNTFASKAAELGLDHGSFTALLLKALEDYKDKLDNPTEVF